MEHLPETAPSGRYTVTVHIAATGTAIGSKGSSRSGHMFYSIAVDGTQWQKSYGMNKNGDGDSFVSSDDVNTYQNPMYARTIEISKEQFDTLHDFGKHSEKYGFDVAHYGKFTNSCIDFTWSALNAAGLHATMPLPKGQHFSVPDFEGSLRVPDNIPHIQSIIAPFEDSQLNRETHRSRPEAGWLKEALFGHIENGTLSPTVAAQASPILGQCLDGVHKLDAAQGRAPHAGSTRMACSLANLAHDNGLQRVDAVYLSQRQSGNETITGERVFVQQGDPRDVAGLRAGMETAQAFSMPLDTSLAQLERTEQQLAQQREHSAQILPDPATRRGMDGPALG